MHPRLPHGSPSRSARPRVMGAAATIAALLALTACQADYSKANGEQGDACRSDLDCDVQWACVAFVCATPPDANNGGPGSDAGPTPYDVPPSPDTGGRPDTGPLPDAGPRPDTPPSPDVGPDTPPDPDSGLICSPGEQFCRDNRTLQRCRSDGQGYVTRACSDDQVCQGDRCVRIDEPICSPGATRCDGNSVVVCNDNGTAWTTLDVCSGDEACRDGRCQVIDTPLPNLVFEDIGVANGGQVIRPGDVVDAFVVLGNSGRAATEPTACSVWLSEDAFLDPARDFEVSGFEAFPDLPPLQPGEFFEIPIFWEVPFGVPEGRYAFVLECNLFETRYEEQTFDDNTIATPFYTLDDGDDTCFDDFLEPIEPATIEPGFYELNLCDREDTFILEVNRRSEIFLLLEPFADVFYYLEILDLNTGEILTAFENVGPSEAAFDVNPGVYLISFVGIDVPDDGVPYFLIYESNPIGDDRLPDLFVDFGFLETDSARQGDQIGFEMSVSNFGDARADFVEVGVYLLQDPFEPVEFGFNLYSTGFPALSAGESFNFFDIAQIPFGIPDGFYEVVFVVDPFNAVPEYDDFENNRFFAQPLIVDSGGVGPACGDDPLEPNNSFQTARRFEPVGDLEVCENDRDWIEVCVGPNQGVEITLAFNHNQGDVDINVYNEDFQSLGGSYSVSNSELVYVETGIEGQCFISEVYLCCGGIRNTYEFAFSSRTLTPCSDALEPNNFEGEAAVLDAALDRDDLGLCPQGDVDFYRFDIDNGEEFILGAISEGDQLNLEILDRFGNFVTSAFGTNPTVTIANFAGGEYLVRITGQGTRRQTSYRLFRRDL